MQKHKMKLDEQLKIINTEKLKWLTWDITIESILKKNKEVLHRYKEKEKTSLWINNGNRQQSFYMKNKYFKCRHSMKWIKRFTF